MFRKMTLTVVMAAVLVAGACSKAVNDHAIANEIKGKMFSAQQLKRAELEVTSQAGQVTLKGEVPDEAARYLAFKLASEVPGVVKVNDQMTVAAAQSLEPPKAEVAPAPAPKPVAHHKTLRRAEAAPRPAPVPAAPAPQESAPAPPAPVPVRAEPPPPPQPVEVEIPAGTEISVKTIDRIDSEINHTGEIFAASLAAPIVVDGDVVVPAGTDVSMRLVDVESAGHMTGRSELRLELVRMVFQGKTYTLQSNTWEQRGSSRGKRTAATVGGGAAIGAAIGAIAGGGKGAAIGGAIGAGGGTAVQAATKGQQIRVAPETKLDFRLEAPVTVSYFPEKNRRASR